MSRAKEPFFVGFYKNPPKALRPFLMVVSAALVVSFGIIAYAVGTTQDDPGPGALRFDYGRQTVTGVVTLDPYPVLHVTQGTERIAEGETLMLSGAGKFGVRERAEPLEGALVEVTGVILERGTIQMLQVQNRPAALTAAEGAVPDVPAPRDLGRWRLAGEICDGKCLSGAMRPGRGLAHKACANLCIIGGVPPVFVTSQPVKGHAFLMVGGADGGPGVPQAVLDNVGSYISVEGRVEERGTVLVFLIEPETIEVMP